MSKNEKKSDFTSGETILFEYILIDDGGVCTRCSPFLMSINASFEHEYGIYRVTEYKRENGKISVICDRLSKRPKIINGLLNTKK